MLTHRGYCLRVPMSGGKAGKGHNKTGTVQVLRLDPDYMTLLKSFRFLVASQESRLKVYASARSWIDSRIANGELT